MSEAGIPFNGAEEIWQFGERREEPSSIQIELRLSGAIDQDRLAAAMAAAVEKHPMARARKLADRRGLRPPEWQILEFDAVDCRDIFRVTRCECDDGIAAIRDAFYSQLIGTDRAPALRLLLVQHAHGVSLLLSLHHAICDGVGSLRFLQSVARAYNGQPDPAPLIDPIAARDLQSRLAPRSPRAPRTGRPQGRFQRPTVVASSGAVDAPGYGICRLTVSGWESSLVAARRLMPSATVNDLLLAALTRAIETWNSSHERPAGRIALLMPLNARPLDWRHDGVINLTNAGVISTTSAQRSDSAALLSSIVDQTLPLKQGEGSFVRPLPNWILQAGRLLIPLLWHAVLYTMTLSNLGRLDEMPDFGPEAGDVSEFYFSPPATMPRGLAIGAVTVNGQLSLCLRYRPARFDAAAGQRFLEGVADALLALGDGDTSSEESIPARAGTASTG